VVLPLPLPLSPPLLFSLLLWAGAADNPGQVR
jgi:hypothetical protein